MSRAIRGCGGHAPRPCGGCAELGGRGDRRIFRPCASAEASEFRRCASNPETGCWRGMSPQIGPFRRSWPLTFGNSAFANCYAIERASQLSSRRNAEPAGDIERGAMVEVAPDAHLPCLEARGAPVPCACGSIRASCGWRSAAPGASELRSAPASQAASATRTWKGACRRDTAVYSHNLELRGGRFVCDLAGEGDVQPSASRMTVTFSTAPRIGRVSRNRTQPFFGSRTADQCALRRLTATSGPGKRNLSWTPRRRGRGNAARPARRFWNSRSRSRRRYGCTTRRRRAPSRTRHGDSSGRRPERCSRARWSRSFLAADRAPHQPFTLADAQPFQPEGRGFKDVR